MGDRNKERQWGQAAKIPFWLGVGGGGAGGRGLYLQLELHVLQVVCLGLQRVQQRRLLLQPGPEPLTGAAETKQSHCLFQLGPVVLRGRPGGCDEGQCLPLGTQSRSPTPPPAESRPAPERASALLPGSAPCQRSGREPAAASQAQGPGRVRSFDLVAPKPFSS